METIDRIKTNDVKLRINKSRDTYLLINEHNGLTLGYYDTKEQVYQRAFRIIESNVLLKELNSMVKRNHENS